jgi:hypothetical protein
MTGDTNRPAYGPAHIHPPAEIDFTDGADQGVRNNPKATPVPIASAGDRATRAGMRSTWPRSDIEDTDLERRVLAHERILQALIAHMAEAEPTFITRLSAVFSDPLRVGRREHDYTDTHAYADRFMRETLRLVGRRSERGAAHDTPPQHLRDLGKRSDAAVVVPEGQAATLLEVSRRAGIWEVTKDGRFYGHYTSDQPAFDAAEAAAFAIVAGGGTADVLWNDGRPSRNAPIGAVQSMEFRPGLTRVVR